jgi:hypothetical protein
MNFHPHFPPQMTNSSTIPPFYCRSWTIAPKVKKKSYNSKSSRHIIIVFVSKDRNMINKLVGTKSRNWNYLVQFKC